jgi:hypothetical protein
MTYLLGAGYHRINPLLAADIGPGQPRARGGAIECRPHR